MLRLTPIALFASFAACSTKDAGGSQDTASEADTDTDTDADADSDTDADTDTPAQGSAVLTRVGTAVVTSDYAGTEELKYQASDTSGAIVCDITYDLASIDVRDDCPDCEWAFDVQSSNAAVAQDSGACLALAGVDATTVDSLNGIVHGYGYNPLYFGHAQVLMTDETGYWGSTAYALFDDGTGDFSYQYLDGYHAY